MKARRSKVIDLFRRSLRSAAECPTAYHAESMRLYIVGKFRDNKRLRDASKVDFLLREGEDELASMNYYHAVREEKTRNAESALTMATHLAQPIAPPVAVAAPAAVTLPILAVEDVSPKKLPRAPKKDATIKASTSMTASKRSAKSAVTIVTASPQAPSMLPPPGTDTALINLLDQASDLLGEVFIPEGATEAFIQLQVASMALDKAAVAVRNAPEGGVDPTALVYAAHRDMQELVSILPQWSAVGANPRVQGTSAKRRKSAIDIPRPGISRPGVSVSQWRAGLGRDLSHGTHAQGVGQMHAVSGRDEQGQVYGHAGWSELPGRADQPVWRGPHIGWTVGSGGAGVDDERQGQEEREQDEDQDEELEVGSDGDDSSHSDAGGGGGWGHAGQGEGQEGGSDRARRTAIRAEATVRRSYTEAQGGAMGRTNTSRRGRNALTATRACARTSAPALKQLAASTAAAIAAAEAVVVASEASLLLKRALARMRKGALVGRRSAE